jgi:hypothetical protein
MIVLNEGNSAGKILVERLHAVQVNAHAASVESWRGGMFDEVIFRDILIEYVGHPNASTSDASLGPPHVDSRNLPCWGWFVRNVKNVTFDNVDICYTGTDPRPAFLFDNVGTIRFNNVKYPESDNLQKTVSRNSGTWYVDGQEVNRR